MGASSVRDKRAELNLSELSFIVQNPHDFLHFMRDGIRTAGG